MEKKRGKKAREEKTQKMSSSSRGCSKNWIDKNNKKQQQKANKNKIL